MGPGALGLSREKVRETGEAGEDVTEQRAQEPGEGGWRLGCRGGAGWTATTLGLGCVEAEKS